MKKQETGLGKYIYMEWLFPVKDYYCSIRKNETIFYKGIMPSEKGFRFSSGL